MPGIASPIRKSVQVQWRDQALNVSFLQRKSGTEWLLLLHGLQSDSSLFTPFFENGAFSNFSLLAPDFLGFGQSDRPKDFTYDLSDQAEVVLGLLSKLHIPRISVVGHSLGGMVATLFLRQMDNLIEKIVSLEGNLTEADCGESLKVSQQTFAEFKRTYAGSVTPPHVFYQTSLSIVEWSRSEKLLKLFKSSKKPKLLVVGDKGKFLSRPPNTEIETINGAGHFLLSDQATATMNAVARFLAR